MDTSSYWIDSARLPEFPAVDRDHAVDVIVVGAGITGVTAAYLLKQAGRTVALIERGRCAQVDTGHTTAHVTCVYDMLLQELVKSFDKPVASAIWDAGGAAIDRIVSLIRAEDIECDFRWVPGYLHVPLTGADDGDRKEMVDEAKLAHELGIAATQMEKVPFVGLPGVRFEQQALFHPRKYLAALLARIPGQGSHVFEQSEVSEVTDEPLAVKVGGHTVRGKYLVLATHSPLTGTASTLGAMFFQTKLALYTSYALGARVPAGLIPPALYWDTSDPYYYLRVEPRDGDDYAIFGGEDHKTGQADDTREPYRKLEEQFRRLVPQAKIDHRWSAQVIETADGLPFIGEVNERQFLATGYAGNGMTFGTLGGMMAVDAVLKRKNPWTELFALDRKKLGSAFKYVSENKDYPYYILRDWLGGAEKGTLESLGRSEGKILHLDGRKVAAYRDADGKVSLCSPVCTHLKCIVGWNEAEQTWDCPCHGSRFKPTGEVISGPAEEALHAIKAS